MEETNMAKIYKSNGEKITLITESYEDSIKDVLD